MQASTNQPATPRRSAVSAEQTRAAIPAATTKVVAQHSLSGTTVERVAVAAGVAPATVILHFKRKEALLVAVLEELAHEFELARQQALAGAAEDPVAALNRLIDVTFDPLVSDPAKIAVWYAFWGEAGSRSVYLERCGSIDTVYFADLEKICTEIARRGGYGHDRAQGGDHGTGRQHRNISGRRSWWRVPPSIARAHAGSCAPTLPYLFPQHFTTEP